MEITRQEAIDIFEALGYEGSESWNKSTLLKRLESLHEDLEPDQIIGDDELDEILDWLFKAGKDGEPIKIVAERKKSTDDEDLSEEDDEVADEEEEEVGEEEEEEKPKPTPKKKAPVKKTPPPPKKTAKKKEETPHPPKKTSKKGPAKEELEKVVKPTDMKKVREELKKEIKKEKKLNRIRPTTTGRPYIAGYILRKHGLENGVTDEMISEMDELCKSSNLTECQAWLKSSWHIVNGYVSGGMGDDDLE